MNAIVSGCRPQFNQNLNDDCGSYFVDLTQQAEFTVGRSIQDMPVNSSCTYRALSTCGYPSAAWRVNNPKIAGDFDIAWATMDDLTPTNELDGWEPNQTTDWKGNYASAPSLEYTEIRQPINETISDQQWSTCKGKVRNIWVSITRVKRSDLVAESAPRQLQFYPNGTHFADFDITFYNHKTPSPPVPKGAIFIKTAVLAIAAGIAALAF